MTSCLLFQGIVLFIFTSTGLCPPQPAKRVHRQLSKTPTKKVTLPNCKG